MHRVEVVVIARQGRKKNRGSTPTTPASKGKGAPVKAAEPEPAAKAGRRSSTKEKAPEAYRPSDAAAKNAELRKSRELKQQLLNFGAFVDIGVHQDGLVHISALSEKFIKDPREAVKAGDVVKVKVMEVDIPRKRVGLSMRMSDTPGEKIDGARGARPGSAPRTGARGV